MRHLLPWIAILAIGCGETEPEIRPLPVGRGAPRASLQPRSAEVVSPELRIRQTTEQAAAERERLGLGAGASTKRDHGNGGGSGPGGLLPPTRREPTAREMEAYRRELADQVEERIDIEDDPCEQLRGAWAAGTQAVDRALPAGRGRTAGAPPSRAQLRRACREMPPGYLRCMDRTYFDEHRDECQLEIRRLARRGRERSEEARTQLDEIERGRAPDPTESDPGAVL